MILKRFIRNRKQRFVVRRTTSLHVDAKRTKTFRCRCRFCEARVTLHLHPSDYRNRYACKSCGKSSQHRDEVLRIDWYRTSHTDSRNRRGGVCTCRTGACHPHRAGSFSGCVASFKRVAA